MVLFALLCRSRSFVALAVTSLLSLLAALMPAHAQTSHYWKVTYSNNGTFQYADRDVPILGQSTAHTVSWPVGSNGGGGGNSSEINGDAEGNVTATLTWIPTNGQTLITDPPPSPVSIIEYGSAWEESIWNGMGYPPNPAGTMDDGWGDPIINGASQGYHVVSQDGSSGVITIVSNKLKAINPKSTWTPIYLGSGYGS